MNMPLPDFAPSEHTWDCINNPVRSRHHDFVLKQQTAYDALSAKGRRLYDNLRTKYDHDHGVAFRTAYEVYGICPTLYL